ncbi:MAG: hypothetical protein K1X75_05440 [Leptospirales bacterium]|nr:hypothetical protein [Leptospirales bacterium]
MLASADDYLIVHKPAGLSFHSEENRPGVLQVVRAMEEAGQLPRGARLFPVHRLDRVTSGILVFARGRKNANLLGNEFRHGRVEKIYAALSDRKPHKKQGQIIGDMAQGRNGQWILLRSHRNPAITRFISVPVPGRRPGLRLYVVKPKTGRTHQIRAALKSIAAPILGDPQYGRFDLARCEDRTYLHASAIRFQLNGAVVSCYSAPADGAEFASREFQQCLAQLGDLLELKI